MQRSNRERRGKPIWSFDYRTLPLSTNGNAATIAALLAAANLTLTRTTTADVCTGPSSFVSGLAVNAARVGELRPIFNSIQAPAIGSGLVIERQRNGVLPTAGYFAHITSWGKSAGPSGAVPTVTTGAAGTPVPSGGTSTLAPDGASYADAIDFSPSGDENGSVPGGGVSQGFGSVWVNNAPMVRTAFLRARAGTSLLRVLSPQGEFQWTQGSDSSASWQTIELDTTWRLFLFALPVTSIGSGGVGFNKINNALTAPIDIWGTQLLSGGVGGAQASRTAMSCAGHPQSNNVSFAGDRLTQTNPAQLIDAGCFSHEVWFVPYGNEAATDGTPWVFYSDGTNKATYDGTTMTITVGAASATVTGVTWTPFDVVKMFIRSGNGATVVVVQGNSVDGPVSFVVTGPSLPAFVPAASIDLGNQAAAGQLVGTRLYEAAWASGDGPSWAFQVMSGAPYVVADINVDLVTGQSLGQGAQSGPVLSTVQPYSNLMQVTGVRAGDNGLTSLVPLIEQLDSAGNGETIASGFANELNAEGLSRVTLAMDHALGSTPYVGLRQRTRQFATGALQVKHALLNAAALNKSLNFSSVLVVHGESDHADGTPQATYAAYMKEWRRTWEEALRAQVPFRHRLPLLQSQISSWTKYGPAATSVIPQAQLDASDGALIVLVCAKYFLTYVDGVHLNAASYRRLGEYYARALKWMRTFLLPWVPVSPKRITRVGSLVRCVFNVPVGPLVFDTVTVTDPNGVRGFEFADDSGATPAIAGVSITSSDAPSDTVDVQLAAVPTGANKFLRYAYTGIAGNNAGPTTGPRGCLRDSDPTTGRDGASLVNWCVHFNSACP